MSRRATSASAITRRYTSSSCGITCDGVKRAALAGPAVPSRDRSRSSSSSRRSAQASASASPGGTCKPSTPSATTSSRPPSAETTHGVPAARHSSATSPNPSGTRLGTTPTTACRHAATTAGCGTFVATTTPDRSPSRKSARARPARTSGISSPPARSRACASRSTSTPL